MEKEGIRKGNFELTARYQAVDSVEIGNGSKYLFDAGAEEGDVNIKKCTVFETSCNLASVVTGSGMLSLPYAAAAAGWSAVGLLVGLGCMFTYAYDLLVCAIDAYKQSSSFVGEEIVGYVELGRHCLGKNGDKLVLLVFATELILALMSFLMNIAINLEVLSVHCTYETGVIVAAIVNILLCSFELKLTAYSSGIGSFMTIFVVIALFWCGEEMRDERADYLQREYTDFHASGMPMAAGLIAFCYGGHSTFPKLYAAMQQPKRYREVLVYAMTTVILLYVSFMVMGYGYYAQYTMAPITLNIGWDTQKHHLPKGHFLRFTAAIGVVCNLLVTCPLVTMPVADTFNSMSRCFARSNVLLSAEDIGGTQGKLATVVTSAAITIVAAALALSLGKSQFAPACGLIGAVASFTDSLLLPVLFYHSLIPRGHSNQTIALHVVLVIVGLACFVSGIVSTACRPGSPLHSDFCDIFSY